MLSRFRALMITLPMTAFLAFGLSACATESEMEPAAAEVEEAAAPSGDVAADLLTDWNRLKDRMVSQAEAMPDELYEYKPTEELRNFAEQIMHITGAQVGLMGPLGSDLEAPAMPEEASEKAVVIQAMIDSFDYGAAVLGGETNESIQEVIDCSYLGTSTKARCVYNNMIHTWSEYGVMTVYHRLNGLVPPASQ